MLRTDVARELRERRAEDGFLFPDYGGYCFARAQPTAASVLGADVGPTLPDDVLAGVASDVGDVYGVANGVEGVASDVEGDANGVDGVASGVDDVAGGVDGENGGDGDGAPAVENVVFVLLDGYGLEQFRRDRADVALLDDLASAGRVTPLTSIYPSETAAAITTLHTGRLPAGHGVLGWDQYVREAGAVLQVLPFATADDEPAGEALGADPRALFDGEPIYPELAAAGVEPVGLFPEGLVDTPYSELTLRGMDARTYANPADAGVQARQALSGAGSTYCYLYVPHVDAAAHRHGTESAEYAAQLELVAACLRRELVEKLDPDVAERTLLVLTADHGEVDTVPDENVDLRDDRFDPLWDALERDPSGRPIPPVGGPRNVQLHLREGAVEDVRALLDAELDAATFTAAEALDRALYGPEPADEPRSETFRRRLPDLTVVPRERSVWHGDDALAQVGMHGGLHPDETLVPFAAARIGALQR